MNMRELKRRYRAIDLAEKAECQAYTEKLDAERKHDEACNALAKAREQFYEYLGSRQIVIGGKLYSRGENG